MGLLGELGLDKGEAGISELVRELLAHKIDGTVDSGLGTDPMEEQELLDLSRSELVCWHDASEQIGQFWDIAGVEPRRLVAAVWGVHLDEEVSNLLFGRILEFDVYINPAWTNKCWVQELWVICGHDENMTLRR